MEGVWRTSWDKTLEHSVYTGMKYLPYQVIGWISEPSMLKSIEKSLWVALLAKDFYLTHLFDPTFLYDSICIRKCGTWKWTEYSVSACWEACTYSESSQYHFCSYFHTPVPTIFVSEALCCLQLAGTHKPASSPLKSAKKKWKQMCVVNLTLTQQLLGWIEVWQTNNTKCWSETFILYITIQVFIKETSFTKSESITTWHQDKREVTEHGGFSKAIQPPMTATIAKVCLVSLRMNGCLFGHPTNPECLSYAPSPSPNQTVLISYLKGLLSLYIHTPYCCWRKSPIKTA